MSQQPRGTCGHRKSFWDNHPNCISCSKCSRDNSCLICQLWPSDVWDSADNRRSHAKKLARKRRREASGIMDDEIHSLFHSSSEISEDEFSCISGDDGTVVTSVQRPSRPKKKSPQPGRDRASRSPPLDRLSGRSSVIGPEASLVGGEGPDAGVRDCPTPPRSSSAASVGTGSRSVDRVPDATLLPGQILPLVPDFSGSSDLPPNLALRTPATETLGLAAGNRLQVGRHRTPDTNPLGLDTGHRTSARSFGAPDTAPGGQGTGRRTPVMSQRTLDTGRSVQDTGHRTPDTTPFGVDTGHRTPSVANSRTTAHGSQDPGQLGLDTGSRPAMGTRVPPRGPHVRLSDRDVDHCVDFDRYSHPRTGATDHVWSRGVAYSDGRFYDHPHRHMSPYDRRSRYSRFVDHHEFVRDRDLSPLGDFARSPYPPVWDYPSSPYIDRYSHHFDAYDHRDEYERGSRRPRVRPPPARRESPSPPPRSLAQTGTSSAQPPPPASRSSSSSSSSVSSSEDDSFQTRVPADDPLLVEGERVEQGQRAAAGVEQGQRAAAGITPPAPVGPQEAEAEKPSFTLTGAYEAVWSSLPQDVCPRQDEAQPISLGSTSEDAFFATHNAGNPTTRSNPTLPISTVVLECLDKLRPVNQSNSDLSWVVPDNVLHSMERAGAYRPPVPDPNSGLNLQETPTLSHMAKSNANVSHPGPSGKFELTHKTLDRWEKRERQSIGLASQMDFLTAALIKTMASEEPDLMAVQHLALFLARSTRNLTARCSVNMAEMVRTRRAAILAASPGRFTTLSSQQTVLSAPLTSPNIFGGPDVIAPVLKEEREERAACQQATPQFVSYKRKHSLPPATQRHAPADHVEFAGAGAPDTSSVSRSKRRKMIQKAKKKAKKDKRDRRRSGERSQSTSAFPPKSNRGGRGRGRP